MRKLLLFCLLVTLYAIPAKGSFSLSLAPVEKKYSISVSQQGQKIAWDGHFSFVAPGVPKLVLPARFSLGVGGGTIRMGYAGFWQEYALLPFFSKAQALVYQAAGQSFMLLATKQGQRAVGYGKASARADVSLLAWMAPKQDLFAFHTEWGAAHARWGVAAKAVLQPSFGVLHAEALFTPAHGLEGFFSSSFGHRPYTLGIAYGQSPYPSRYSFALEHECKAVRTTFVMEEWLGAEPVYGGHSSIRTSRRSSSVKLFLKTGSLVFSASDTYASTRKGTGVGSAVVQAKWKAPFGQVAVSHTQGRGSSGAEGDHKVSLTLYKATLSHTKKGYVMTVSDSFAMGEGSGTWRVTKRMGEACAFSFLYALTTDR